MDYSVQESLFEDRNSEKNKKKIPALDQLFARSARYKDSKEYYNLIKFINRFPNLSPFNAFLVHTQNSGVSVVLSASKWANYGRNVKYNARPLVILVPFGPVDFVYDIADTEGEPVPDYLINPFTTKGILKKSIYLYTLKACEKEKLSILEYEMHKGSAGYAHRIGSSFGIKINSSYSINEKYSTLIHELAHILCGHLGSSTDCWWKDRSFAKKEVEEIEAESISYLVCKRLGLETSSESYLSNYITNNKKLPPISFDTILTVTGYIELMGTARFRSKRK